jgi:hypothetical protein
MHNFLPSSCPKSQRTYLLLPDEKPEINNSNNKKASTTSKMDTQTRRPHVKKKKIKRKKKPPNKQTNKHNQTKPALQQRKTDKNQTEKRRERDTEKEWRTGRGGKEFVRKRGRETTAASTVRPAGSPTASACQPTRGSRETETPEDKGATGRYVRRSLTRPPDRPTDRPPACP